MICPICRAAGMTSKLRANSSVEPHLGFIRNPSDIYYDELGRYHYHCEDSISGYICSLGHDFLVIKADTCENDCPHHIEGPARIAELHKQLRNHHTFEPEDCEPPPPSPKPVVTTSITSLAPARDPLRRAQTDLYTAAEHACRAAVVEIERLPADVTLTSAQGLIMQAQNLVADYAIARDLPPRPYIYTIELKVGAMMYVFEVDERLGVIPLPISDATPRDVPIILIGPSGYNAPHDRYARTAKWLGGYWFTECGDNISDGHPNPTHWLPLFTGPLP